MIICHLMDRCRTYNHYEEVKINYLTEASVDMKVVFASIGPC